MQNGRKMEEKLKFQKSNEKFSYIRFSLLNRSRISDFSLALLPRFGVTFAKNSIITIDLLQKFAVQNQ